MSLTATQEQQRAAAANLSLRSTTERDALLVTLVADLAAVTTRIDALERQSALLRGLMRWRRWVRAR